MAEVVGTAYVRIRAITAQLRKDIEDAVKQGAKDADVNSAADDVGSRFSERLAKNIGDDVSDAVSTALVKADASGAGQVVARNFSTAFEREVGQRLDRVNVNVARSFSIGMAGNITRAFRNVDFDFDLPELDGERGFIQARIVRSAESAGELVGGRFALGVGSAISSGLENVIDVSSRALLPGGGGGDSSAAARGGRSFGESFINNARKAIVSGAQAVGPPLQRFFQRLGQSNARSYGGGFRGTIARYLVALAPALVAPLAGVLSLIIQYVITLVGQLGFLVTAAVGAGVAIGTAFGAALLGIVPLLAAFAAETPELESLKAAADGLKESFTDMGREVQRILFPALEDLFGLLEDDLLPSMTGFAQAIGTVSANLVRSVGDILRSQQAAGRLNTIWAFSADIFQSFGNAALNVFNGLIVLFTTALPIAQRFADSIENLAARWNLFITRTEGEGTLGAQLQLWYDRAVLVFHILGDIAVGLWNVFTIGASVATPFFDRFAAWAAEWRDFTQSEVGQNRIQEVFENASVVAHEFNLLVRDIMSALFDSAVDGENSVLVSVLRSIREDWLPGIDNILTRIAEQTGPELADLFVTIGDILNTLSETGALSVTATILASIASILETLVSIPGVGQFLGLLIGIVGAFKILSLLRIPQIISGVVTAIEALMATAAGPVVAAVAAGLAVIAYWVDFVRDRWGELSSAIPLFLGPLAIAGFVIGGLIETFDTLVRVLGNVVDFFLRVGGTIAEPIIDAFQRLWHDVLEPFMDFLAGAFSSAWDVVKSAVASVASFLGGAGAGLFDGITTAIDFLWNSVLVPFGNFLSSVFPTIWDAAGAAISWFVDNVVNPLGDAIMWVWDTVLVPFGQWLGDRFAPLWDTIVQVWQEDIFPILQDLGDRFTWFKDTVLSPLMDFLGTVFGPVWDALLVVLGAVSDFIRSDFSSAFLGLISIFSPIAGVVGGAVAGAFRELWQNVLVPLWGFISSAFSVVWQLLVSVWQTAVVPAINAIGAAFMWLYNTVLLPVWNFIGTVFSAVWTALSFVWNSVLMPAISAVGAALMWLWTTIIAPVASFLLGSVIPIITAMADALIGQLSFAINAVGAVISFVYNTFFIPFADFLQVAFTAAINVAKAAWDGLKVAIDAISAAISYVWNTWLQPFIDFLGAAFTTALNAAKAVINSLKNAFDDVAGAVESAWGWVQDLIDAINDIPALPDIGGGGGGLFGAGGFGPLGGLLGANGGIFDRATPMIIGEAGKEVLLPLTRPQRARELAAASGAYDVLLGGRGQQTSVTFGENSIKLEFSGVPTQSEARGLGRQVGLGIQDVIAKRRIQNGSRTA